MTSIPPILRVMNYDDTKINISLCNFKYIEMILQNVFSAVQYEEPRT